MLDWPERTKATQVDGADMTLIVLEPEDRENGTLARFANGTIVLPDRLLADGAVEYGADHLHHARDHRVPQ